MNNQMNNRLTVNDGVQRMIDNNSAMYYRNQMTIAQNMSHRPVNTIKAYSAKQKEWKRGRKLRRNPDGTLIALGRESVFAYQAKALGLNPMVPQEDPSLELFWLLSKKKKVKSKRQNFEDRGKNTLNDGYIKQELEKVNGYPLTEKNDHLGCRDRFCFLISHTMLCRSQTALGKQFADLLPLVLEIQGISKCIILAATITFGYVSHLVLNGRNCFEEITYQKQYKTYKRVLNTVGIDSFKVTDINHGSVLI
ncbi:hypothetical protein BCV71DRAFT_283188 [Rhizopus microsporus]|uniref:Ndc10 domain-containing protein n=1 Tax=Rhizopus microsporus TaxID=58291 RepID=A0A1X0S5M6_RHIZD|nr:hypothetical protein BCV71DRAFT_283188 [Rhizopus microsporus]